MSAIVGIHYLDGRPVDQAALERMVASLAYRGPDGLGCWSEGPTGLGHRMLQTTPESLGERSPSMSRPGALIITADARIDNRDELIDLLGLASRAAEEIADSELIMAAYERWGESCPARLLGDFAFAIWDRRRQTLFCARDAMGVKPLYYYYQADRAFVFASEIKALHCLPEVPRRLNERRVAQYLTQRLEDGTATFYQEIAACRPLTASASHRRGFTFVSIGHRIYLWNCDCAQMRNMPKLCVRSLLRRSVVECAAPFRLVRC